MRMRVCCSALSTPPAFPVQTRSLKYTVHMRIQQLALSPCKPFSTRPFLAIHKAPAQWPRSQSSTQPLHTPLSRSAMLFGPAPSPTSLPSKLSQCLVVPAPPLLTFTLSISQSLQVPPFILTRPPPNGKTQIGLAPSL